MQISQQGDQGQSFGADDKLFSFALDVTIVNQTFDDLRARRWSAEAAFAHRLAQLFVLDQFSASSMAESKVASVNRAGGFVSFSLTSTASTLADSLGATATI